MEGKIHYKSDNGDVENESREIKRTRKRRKIARDTVVKKRGK